MKYFFSVLLILLYCNANLKASSKNDFKEGYIISLKGDTTKGFLLAQESRNASEKCIFKPNAGSESKIYQPGEIAGYRYLDGKYYISKEINIDSTTTKVVFLEFLIKGVANVYYYVDNKEHYYIEKSPKGLLELTEEQTTFSDDKGRTYINPSKYMGKLIFTLQDCPGINKEIQNTKLTHKSLIKLTKDYHAKVCNSESCIIYERNNTSVKVKFGLLMGFSKNKYNFGGALISDYKNIYQIGAGMKISNIFMFTRHLNLKINFLFEQDSKSYLLTSKIINYKYLKYNDNTIPIFKGTNLQADLNVTDLKIPLTLNYDFNITPKTIYTFGIGISDKIILSHNKNLQFYSSTGQSYQSFHSLLAGVIVTTGIEGNWFGKHTLFVNAGYEYLMDLKSVDPTLKVLNNQFSLQIGMYF